MFPISAQVASESPASCAGNSDQDHKDHIHTEVLVLIQALQLWEASQAASSHQKCQVIGVM